jgi:ferric-dicitrate binding protein FerR (iron transport regulator)
LTTDSKHIDYLISRYLAGEASSDERLQLERWMDESDVNKKYFNDIRFVHDKAVASHQVKRVNVDMAWTSVYQQMHEPSTKKVQAIKLFPQWLRAAAAVLLLFGVAFWLYTSYFSVSGKDVVITSKKVSVNHELADKSLVVLSKNTKITYGSHFGKKKREVTLSGEANFNVQHITDLPFIVVAEGTLVKDIGTSFLVKAKPTSAIVEVYVESGKVAFYSGHDSGVELSKGETGIYEKATKIFRKFKVMENIILKESKVMIFRNAELSYVIEQLAVVYHTDIRLSNKQLSNCRITVAFENENLDSLLGIITETLGLRSVKTENGYLLQGDYCNSQN